MTDLKDRPTPVELLQSMNNGSYSPERSMNIYYHAKDLHEKLEDSPVKSKLEKTFMASALCLATLATSALLQDERYLKSEDETRKELILGEVRARYTNAAPTSYDIARDLIEQRNEGAQTTQAVQPNYEITDAQWTLIEEKVEAELPEIFESRRDIAQNFATGTALFSLASLSFALFSGVTASRRYHANRETEKELDAFENAVTEYNQTGNEEVFKPFLGS